MWRSLSLALAEALEGMCISVTSLTRITMLLLLLLLLLRHFSRVRLCATP